ncbi:MAG: DNA repair protein RecN [bacterium]|nr:MAG: DNA repair protein RecN [bacterium]
MLQELRIRNLAVVEDAVIPFDDGLNVLTGSTGAGKSIILTAVELLSGGRGRRSLLRHGAEKLTVEGTFTVPDDWTMRDSLAMDGGDEALSIKRELSAEGKSRIWINGVVTTNAVAREAALSLLELHGQHRQQELLDTANHIRYLDSWGDYGGLLGDAVSLIERYRVLAGHLEDLRQREKKHQEQEEFLRFQLRELEDLGLEPGLDEELKRKIARSENIHRYSAGLVQCRESLGGEEGSVVEKLTAAEKVLKGLSSIDDSWQNTIVELEAVRITVQEILRGIDRSLDEVQDQPADLEQLQERLAKVQRAGRKYGLDGDGLIERRDELRNVLRSLEDGSEEIAEAERELEAVRTALVPLLDSLSTRRTKAARRLDREVTEELHRLGMKGALFRTRIERLDVGDEDTHGNDLHLTDCGWDKVAFEIRTNVGEQMHPLDEVASGGELSRITLVLKKLQIEERGIPTLIFDEIDVGLGADLGKVIAQRLNDLAKRYQIICITHLPQVAAFAAHHVAVRKRVRDGRTTASASVLTGESRVGEIARMLGGRGGLREELATELLKEKQSARSSAG